MVLNGRHSLGSSSLVPLAATANATSATSPSTTTCGSKSLRHFWCGTVFINLCPLNLICTFFLCIDFPANPLSLSVSVKSLLGQVACASVPVAEKAHIESGNIASHCVPGYSATGLHGLAGRLNGAFPMTASRPTASAWSHALDVVLVVVCPRACGYSALRRFDVSQTAMPLAFPHDGFPSASTPATRSISGRVLTLIHHILTD